MAIKLIVENAVTYIEGQLPKGAYQKLKKELGYIPEDAYFKIQNTNKNWSGLISTLHYNKKWCRCAIKRDGIHFPTGLYSKVSQFLRSNGIRYETIDARQAVDLGNPMSMSEKFELRDYQTETIERAIAQQRGIIKAATGAGKTGIAAAMIAKLNVEPFIFYVTSKDLLNQAKSEFEKFIRYNGEPIEVGVVGGSVCDIKDITVMTVQTAVRALGLKYKKADEDDKVEKDSKEVKNHYDDIKSLIISAKAFMADEVQHWSSESCQIISDFSENAYYKWGLSVGANSKVEIKGNNFDENTSITIKDVWRRSVSYADTSIQCIKDLEILNVEDLDIYSRGWIRDRFGWKKVKNIIRHWIDETCYEIHYGNSSKLIATKYHSIYRLSEKGKIETTETKNLKVGDILLADDSNEKYEIKLIQKNRYVGYVYDFEMDHEHPSFVANGILVHNSATPWRDKGDDILIDACFGKLISNISASYLIRKGYLVKPNIYFVPMNNGKEIMQGHTYPTIYESTIVNNNLRNTYIANIATSLAEQGNYVLILCRQIAHGKMLEDMIEGSTFLHGSCKDSERKEHLDKIRNRDESARITIASSIFDEGVDCKPLTALILAGSGKSQTRALQRVGRVLRTFPDKTTATVVDFDDNWKYMSSHSRKRRKIYSTEPEFNIENMEI
jgi:superfamily II DNA or RNA helicase